VYFICKGDKNVAGLDELHVVMPGAFSKEYKSHFKKIRIIRYDNPQKSYLIERPNCFFQ
jgi:hypothetical protein